MDRIQFDNLDLQHQVEYINQKLASGISLTKECDSLGIDRTTVRKRFSKGSWIFDKTSNQYIKTNAKDKSNTKVIQQVPQKNIPALNPNDLKVLQDFSTIKNDLFELIAHKDEIFDIIKNYKSNTNVIEIPELNINDIPAELQGNVSSKSLKIYDSIYELFDDLCKKYPSIKKQDMTSLALLEFYNKYKK